MCVSNDHYRQTTEVRARIREVMYRTNAKPKKIIPINISNVPGKHLEWFLEGVRATIKAYETANEEVTIADNEKKILDALCRRLMQI